MSPGVDRKNDTMRIKQLKALYAVTDLISSKLTLSDILESVPSAVQAITGSSEMCVALVSKMSSGFEIDRDAMKYQCPHPTHLLSKDNRWHIVEAVIDTGKPAWVLSSGELISCDEFSDELSNDIVFAVIPLVVRNQRIGFLAVLAPKGSRFKRVDIILLAILTNQVAAAIKAARLQGQMRELALAKERNRIVKELVAVIMKDNVFNTRAMATPTIRAASKLTEKEMRILTLMAEGYTNEEIAKELWVGIKTVKTHVSSILKKLGQKNRVQAITSALKSGLIEFTPD